MKCGVGEGEYHRDCVELTSSALCNANIKVREQGLNDLRKAPANSTF